MSKINHRDAHHSKKVNTPLVLPTPLGDIQLETIEVVSVDTKTSPIKMLEE